MRRRVHPADRSRRTPARGLRLVAELDRQTAEVFQLEVRRVVQRYGVNPASVRVEIVRREERLST